jgi:hypothetical protein
MRVLPVVAMVTKGTGETVGLRRWRRRIRRRSRSRSRRRRSNMQTIGDKMQSRMHQGGRTFLKP